MCQGQRLEASWGMFLSFFCRWRLVLSSTVACFPGRPLAKFVFLIFLERFPTGCGSKRKPQRGPQVARSIFPLTDRVF